MGKNIEVRKKFLKHASGLHDISGKKKVHGKISDNAKLTKFNEQKAKIQQTYLINDKQLNRYLHYCLNVHDPATDMFRQLERRLDNVLYRLGMATDRVMAKKLIAAGQVLVNGERLGDEYYHVEQRDRISLLPELIAQLEERGEISKSKPATIPSWLQKKNDIGTIKHLPKKDDVRRDIDFEFIVEFFAQATH